MLEVKKAGIRFNVLERSDLFWRNVQRNKWENATFRILKTFIKSNKSYIDMGAWIGPTVLFGAQCAKHCYAVEPDRVAYKELCTNVALNPTFKDKVDIYNGCIWKSSGTVEFGSQSTFGDSTSSVLFAKGKNVMVVEALSFHDFLRKYNINDCVFIKMDIEGGEADVLPTMMDYISQNRPVIYLSLHPKWFVDRESSNKRILDVLKAYQYIYNASGKRISLENLKNILVEQDVTEVVVSDKPWPLYSRLINQILCGLRK